MLIFLKSLRAPFHAILRSSAVSSVFDLIPSQPNTASDCQADARSQAMLGGAFNLFCFFSHGFTSLRFLLLDTNLLSVETFCLKKNRLLIEERTQAARSAWVFQLT